MANSASYPTSSRLGSESEYRPKRASPWSGIRLGKIFGVQVTLDYSVFLIALLLTFNLGAGVLPAWHPEWPSSLAWTVALAAALLFLGSILAHELSHALVGRRMGVRVSGITLFLFGGMAHLESEPKRPRAELLMAIAGPLTSFAIGAGSIALGLGLAPEIVAPEQFDSGTLRQFGPGSTLFLWLGTVNIWLGIFNLVPGFPLDGGRVLRAILWWTSGSFVRATRWASGAGQAFAWTLMLAGMLMMFGYRIPLFGVGLGAGLWLLVIGWFLNTAALRSREQVLLTHALEDVPVRTLMLTHLDSVTPETTLDELVHERLLHSDQRCYPVNADGRFVGIVCLSDVRKVRDAEWPMTEVRNVMTPAEQLVTVAPEDHATTVVQVLAERDVDQVPVVEQGALKGIVRRRDVVKWAGLRGPLSN